jgi:hypothetical protein
MAPVGAQSPRFKARLAGAFYLLNIATGAAAIFLSGPLGSAALLIATASYIAVTVLLYQLFRAVHRELSAVAAGLSLIGCAISALTTLHFVSIGLSPLVFFGFYCLLIGYLIVRSTFLPPILGGLLAVGGLGWLTYLSVPLSRSLSPYNMAPGVLSEAALAFWLISIGVNVERWTAQNRASR